MTTPIDHTKTYCVWCRHWTAKVAQPDAGICRKRLLCTGRLVTCDLFEERDGSGRATARKANEEKK